MASYEMTPRPHHDPALDPEHEHTHGHLHHVGPAAHQGEHDAVYTRDIAPQPAIIPDPRNSTYTGGNEHVAGKDMDKNAYARDIEKGTVSPASRVTSSEGNAEEPDPKSHRAAHLYKKFRPLVHFAIFAVVTGWWVSGLVLHHDDMNWLIPFLVWLFIMIRLVTFYIPISYVSRPMRWTWNRTFAYGTSFIPEKYRLPLGAAGTVATILVGSFASKETEDNTRENRAVSLFGLVVLLFGLWITSRNRKAINWHPVIVGMLLQFLIALFVLRTEAGYDIFDFISGLARSLLGFAKDGVAFLTTDEIAHQGFFFFSVLPAIIFFISLVNLLYYWGTLQWFIKKAGVFFHWAMRMYVLRGFESCLERS